MNLFDTQGPGFDSNKDVVRMILIDRSRMLLETTQSGLRNLYCAVPQFQIRFTPERFL